MFEKIYKNNTGINIKGRVLATVRGPDGKVKDKLESHNVIVDGGKSFLVDFLGSAAAAASTFTMQYVAVGSDSTAEGSSDTALGVEIGRHTGTVSALASHIYQITASFATGSAVGAVAEYGLFSSNTADVMMGRMTSSVVNVGANDTLEVKYQITFS
jgi:hypothetical protein